ncbi:MAG TPA: hypothetical protein VK808_08875 [Bacteroidia bacterium]|jgi:hypothetical protein|nr:hypothetical protein [Bacteroidia bacterium]
MTPEEFIAKQSPDRQPLLRSIHEIILKTNKKAVAEVAPMMRQEMIQYKVNNYFVYALASPKTHMSIHAMPMYCTKSIHEKFSKLLKKAKFQKGCINFKDATEMPLDIAEDFMTECAKIDWVSVMKKYKK